MATESILTDQEQIFVEKIVSSCKATDAARAAQYKNPNKAGYRLLKTPKIQEAIKIASQGGPEKSEVIDASWVLQQSVEVYNRSTQRRPVMVYDPRFKKKIPLVDENGAHVWQHDAQISIKALTLVGNHVSVKAFAEKAIPEGAQEEEYDYSQLTADELERMEELASIMAKAVKKK